MAALVGAPVAAGAVAGVVSERVVASDVINISRHQDLKQGGFFFYAGH